jgi:hypothetical protein
MGVSEQTIPGGSATSVPAGDKPPKRRGPGRPKGSKNKPKNPVDQVAREAEGNGDSPPKKGTRKKRVSKKVTQQIEDALAEIFCAPAIGTAMIGDEWATNHFTESGKELAHRIAKVSERNDQLRRWCEKALDSESIMVLAFASIMYAMPPLIHWNLLPVPPAAGALMGIPQRPTRRRPQPQAPPSAATEWEDDPDEYEFRQRQHEENLARQAANGNGAVPPEPEPMYAEFSDDDESEPPTFIESPVG